MLSLFAVDQFKYNVKRLELFKIRHYNKCPLLLLLLLLCNREFELYKLEHIFNKWKFRSKVQFSYKPKNMKDLKHDLFQKPMVLEPLSEMFIRSKQG